MIDEKKAMEYRKLWDKIEQMNNKELLHVWHTQDWYDCVMYSENISMDDYRQMLYSEIGSRNLSAV